MSSGQFPAPSAPSLGSVSILVSRAGVDGNFHAKRDFADEVKNPEMGRLPWILKAGPGSSQDFSNVLSRGNRREESQSQRRRGENVDK